MTFARSSLRPTAALQLPLASLTVLCIALIACGDDDSNDKTSRDAAADRDGSDSSGRGGEGGHGGKDGGGGTSGDTDASIDAGEDARMPAADCGDGVVDEGEDCDDHNTEAGDGCDASCKYESGWSCSTDQPTVCDPRCGDGKRVGAETAADRCDDHAKATGDGCDAQCHVEAGWTCSGEPSACTKLCGNGALDSGEACDDGNANAADGCAACAIQTHWHCSGAPSTCTADPDANLLKSGGMLAAFSTLDPAHVQTPVAVTGLVAGDTLVAIDRRPTNGMLYGLGYNASMGTAQLYIITSETAQAVALGSATQFTSDGSTPVNISGTQFGMDFNPTADRLRVVNNQGQNFRINPNNGVFVDGDGNVTGIQPDAAINGGPTGLDECAYTNNSLNAVSTTLYTIENVTDHLYIQNPANTGTQTMAMVLAPTATAIAGFDIPAGVDASSPNAAVSGNGFLALRITDESEDAFARIDLMTGAITKLASIGTNTVGMALHNLDSLPIYALSSDGTQLWRFMSTYPGGAQTVNLSAGIVAGESLVDIDFRPATGELFALGINATSNTGTLYTLDPISGGATVIGSASQIAFLDSVGSAVDMPSALGGGWGIDFNPVADRLRVVAETGLNFRVNPNTGAPIDGDSGNAGTNPDGVITGLDGGSTGVAGVAYTNAYGGSSVSTLYLLDASANKLCISATPNGGNAGSCVSLTLGAQPLDVSVATEIDLASDVRVETNNVAATGNAYAAVSVGGRGHLYTIDLATGAATDRGQIGSTGPAIAGLTVGHATVR